VKGDICGGRNHTYFTVMVVKDSVRCYLVFGDNLHNFAQNATGKSAVKILQVRDNDQSFILLFHSYFILISQDLNRLSL
jgi:predicted secreted acid phosphatase